MTSTTATTAVQTSVEALVAALEALAPDLAALDAALTERRSAVQDELRAVGTPKPLFNSINTDYDRQIAVATLITAAEPFLRFVSLINGPLLATPLSKFTEQLAALQARVDAVTGQEV